ncbi:MAG: hypothetical protein ACKVOE_07980 [Rickettsiales bacterium]
MRIVTKDPEVHLIELLGLIEENLSGWQAICFSFSQLREHYRSEYQIKIATNLMNDLLGDRDGAIYLCEDTTIYVMVRSFPKQLLDKMIFQLRYLFMDDPLSYSLEGDENPEFATLYEIENQWQDFQAIIKRRLVMRVRTARAASTPSAGEVKASHAAQKPQHQMQPPAPPEPKPAPVVEAPPPKPKTPYVSLKPAPRETKQPSPDASLCTATNLAGIERDLRDTDLTSAIRRQSVCAAIPGAAVRTVFDEMYIHINQLKENLGTQVDLLSNRWLFKYLTQMLDMRMLDTIQRNPIRYLANPISLNLNIPTVLSTRFVEFDAAIKPSTKVPVVIELQIADVFVDMAAFLAAKDAVQKMGYRVCLDGVSDISFPQIDRQRLGFDLIKLIWNADSAKEAQSEKNIRLAEAVRQCGPNRVILTRCDNLQAVEFGQALGISLFQGRYLDLQISPRSAVKN